MPGDVLVMGAVAYDPKVVTIWAGFRAWLADAGLPFDFVLYSNYERQVEDLVAGSLDAAWNSPLAWVRAERLAAARGRRVRSAVMRDTDQDLTSVVVVRADSGIGAVAELSGRTVGTGAVDSPQATLLPLSFLRGQGLDTADVTVRRFDVGVGLHGDHVGGERDAARALMAGEVDAACMIDGNHLLFTQEGVLPAGATRVLAQTPVFDHCTMAIVDTAPPGLADRFVELLLSMSYGDPVVRPLLDLEGLRQWRVGRTSGFGPLSTAVDESGFYGPDGSVLALGYRP
ncbi:phosphate/phosphite/phosphonate ABC transporter substrate-binding protein [Modestobacter roseus]|uniref:ABC-type phosphate/phosphonate transport system substrate-binding protein n=1 Tax=Modestobacter roseus TaxID=1181884 RepID=A0A562IP66_9ACTN|nr:PhnD/SsuA/transferrin family substrate-binding protein [Modestobacter roseus]MQA35376.1 PhnD/SsuA/transferrin family substrate-binding protein [Modestobacter roseus]TWH72771.1 ABC-type phosphate/phosphonate transport system substrate-binding protein [Modestobacter roseus]